MDTVHPPVDRAIRRPRGITRKHDFHVEPLAARYHRTGYQVWCECLIVGSGLRHDARLERRSADTRGFEKDDVLAVGPEVDLLVDSGQMAPPIGRILSPVSDVEDTSAGERHSGMAGRSPARKPSGESRAEHVGRGLRR